MKTKLSISIDSSLLQKIDNLVELGIFRSRSHAIDFSIVGAKYGRGRLKEKGWTPKGPRA